MKVKHLNTLMLLFMFHFSTVGQNKLLGKYAYNDGNGIDGVFGTTIEFYPNYSFSYYEYNCMTDQIGKGHYEMKKGILYLNFERDDTLESSYKMEVEKSLNGRINYSLKVKLIDRDTLEEPQMIYITIKGKNIDNSIMESTDKYGNFNYETEMAIGTISFEIVPNQDYKKITIIGDLSKGFKADVLLARNCEHCIDLKQMKYSSVKVLNDKFVCKKQNKQITFIKSGNEIR